MNPLEEQQENTMTEPEMRAHIRTQFARQENYDEYYEGDLALTPDGQVSAAGFDRWLAAHDAEVRAEERAKRPDREQLRLALDEHHGWNIREPHTPEAHYVCTCGETFTQRRSEMAEAWSEHRLDAVLSSFALEPEASEDKLEHLAAVTNINLITKAMLEEVGYPSHFHPADAPSWAYSVLEEEHEARTAPEAREETGPALRIDDDGAHIYWADPLEGCWVAFKRVDCVGEEELPERRLPAPEAREEAELFHDQDGDLWKFTDKGEWFHEEEPGEFRQVLSIDAEDQTLTPVGHAELAPDAEAYDVTDTQANTARRVLDTHYLIPVDGPDPDPSEVHCHCGLKFAATSAGWREFHLHGPRAALEAAREVE